METRDPNSMKGGVRSLVRVAVPFNEYTFTLWKTLNSTEHGHDFNCTRFYEKQQVIKQWHHQEDVLYMEPNVDSLPSLPQSSRGHQVCVAPLECYRLGVQSYIVCECVWWWLHIKLTKGSSQSCTERLLRDFVRTIAQKTHRVSRLRPQWRPLRVPATAETERRSNLCLPGSRPETEKWARLPTRSGPTSPFAPSHAERWIPKWRFGAGARSAPSPTKKQTKRSKLTGRRTTWRRSRKKKGGEKKKKTRSKKMAHPRLPRRLLGRQGVVVAFAALALAAQHDGCGQEEEGGGDQQQEAEAGKDPHHLEKDGRRATLFQRDESKELQCTTEIKSSGKNVY